MQEVYTDIVDRNKNPGNMTKSSLIRVKLGRSNFCKINNY